MKKFMWALLALILIILLAALWYFQLDTANPYSNYSWGRFSGQCKNEAAPRKDFGKDFAKCDYSVPEAEIPTFSTIDFPFKNDFDAIKSLPLMASAMIDVDNDGIDEVFVGGGNTQADVIFKYTANGFEDITASFPLPAKPSGKTTYGVSSFDLDKDGNTDLILTGNYGLYWYRNTGQGFEAKKINAPLNEKSSAVTTTIGDFNRDGHPDIFLSAYLFVDRMQGQTIFKDASYGASSLLLQNNGDNTFTDVTKAVGLDYIHNTFQAVLVDMDNDSYLDLVVAYDTGEARTYKNINGQQFKPMPNPMTGKYGYPMGIAVGDYNNDGLVDFFFSNTGSSVPKFLARGDLAEEDIFNEKWMLFRNDGGFKFTDVAKETKVADFEFSWGALFEDFNLDGRQDLVVAENYVAFPPHQLFKLPCRFLLQRPNGTFAAVEDQAGVVNKNFAITPLSSDFNQDGYPDLLYTNLGGTIKALINKGGTNNYIAFRFPENGDYAGSRLALTLENGQQLSDVYVIGEGLGSDQTSTLTFGLGTIEAIQNAVIYLPSGTQITIEKPATNKVHLVGG